MVAFDDAMNNHHRHQARHTVFESMAVALLFQINSCRALFGYQ
jgi:hypothetical protein